MIRDLARRIAEEKILPVRAEMDEKEEFPWDVFHEMATADIFRVFIPEAYGGLGGSVMEFVLVIEELSRICAGIGVGCAASVLGAIPIILYGSEEQKQKYLPDIASGRKLTAFAVTESQAGSDAAAIRTTAVKEPDGYLLNGNKQFITNAGIADINVIVVLTDPAKGPRGATAIIVEKNTPGFSFGKKEKKMGIRASITGELVMRNCKVPLSNLLGREGMGFIIALRTLDRARPGVAGQAVGLAQGALEMAVAYAKERIQFGKPISSFQAVQHILADMAIQIEAARALTYAVAKSIDAGAKSFTEEAAMVKVFASDMAMKVTTDAVQILGGAGYMRDYPVEKMMRDAKITQIYEGTNQILRNTIALEVLKRKGKR